MGITRVDEPAPHASVASEPEPKIEYRKFAVVGTDLKLLNLQPTIHASRFELSKEYQRLIEIYEQILCFYFNDVFGPVRFTGMPGSRSRSKKNPEANKLALEGAEAAKSQDWDKAVDLLKKATAMDHKYGDELSAVYQRRGYAAANDQRYGDAINDYNEALKLTPQDAPRIHEQRAAVEMKIQDYDKALADYSELIKLKPNEIKYLNYRAYIYELKTIFKIRWPRTKRF